MPEPACCFQYSVILSPLTVGCHTSEDTVSALEAFKHVATVEGDARPYLDELGPRVGYVEKELREAALEAESSGGESGYLCGGFSYADLFTLPIVLLAAKYELGGEVDPEQYVGQATTATRPTPRPKHSV